LPHVNISLAKKGVEEEHHSNSPISALEISKEGARKKRGNKHKDGKEKELPGRSGIGHISKRKSG